MVVVSAVSWHSLCNDSEVPIIVVYVAVWYPHVRSLRSLLIFLLEKALGTFSDFVLAMDSMLFYEIQF